MARPIRRLLLGKPLPSSADVTERLTIPRAMGAFGLDALSSVAYGPDQIVIVLVLAGTAGIALDIPVAVAIAALLGIVAFSYRQTIHAYPQGGGSYTVARENLGTAAGLIAAAALMVDYLTTVAVSVTAGVQALVALLPKLAPYKVELDVAMIVLLVLINLRGIREAGAAFILPTYVFIGSLALLVAIGFFHMATGTLPPRIQSIPAPVNGLTIFLVLRAFAGGCTAMTGVEAIANGVPAFKPPATRHAARTLLTLAAILAVLFLGIAILGHALNAVPNTNDNIVALVGLAVVGRGPIFAIVQVSSASILLLAANTSFNGFPRLAAVMAADDWFPHQFTHRGMRLAYSNGVIIIGVLAALLVVIFRGSTNALIPLFAVGVFLCFTLSQSGMILHWWRQHQRGWRWRLLVNGVGAVTTGLVTAVVVITKFVDGAWIVTILVPLLVAGIVSVHHHYAVSRAELECPGLGKITTTSPHVLVPVQDTDRATAAALNYARSISHDVTAVHIATEEDHPRLAGRWKDWAPGVALQQIASPHREVVHPLMAAIDTYLNAHPHKSITIVIPEVVPRHVWEEPLHNQLGLAIKVSLLRHPRVVVTSVPTVL